MVRTILWLVLFAACLYIGVSLAQWIKPTRADQRQWCKDHLVVWDNKRCGGPR